MASHPVFTVTRGAIEMPDEVLDDPRFLAGTTFELISNGSTIVLRPTGFAGAPQTGDWRRLKGVLRSLPYDLNDQMEADKLREMAADERMMHGRTSER